MKKKSNMTGIGAGELPIDICAELTGVRCKVRLRTESTVAGISKFYRSIGFDCYGLRKRMFVLVTADSAGSDQGTYFVVISRPGIEVLAHVMVKGALNEQAFGDAVRSAWDVYEKSRPPHPSDQDLEGDDEKKRAASDLYFDHRFEELVELIKEDSPCATEEEILSTARFYDRMWDHY